MQHKVGFIKGINKDLAKDKYSNSNYFHANNVKVITDVGMSTGSIENEKGTSELFKFPTVGARYKVTIASATVTIGGYSVTITSSDTNQIAYNKLIANAGVAGLISNGSVYLFYNNSGVYIQVKDTAFTVSGSVTTYSTATSSIYICGWTRLNEWLIVFTSASETLEPTSALCQIWKFKFESGSRTQIDGASGTTLVASQHLIYNDFLNYSTQTYIRDIVANYETSTKGRVYWTDYYNQVRVANVFDTDLMSVKVEDLGLVSEVTLSKPVINKISNAGSLPAGATYQYFYKLISKDGRESIFSTGSQVLDVQEDLSSDTSVDYYDLVSTPADTIENKEFTIRINDIDEDFDFIELYCVIWESLNSPAIYKVDEYGITGSTMNIVHSSLDSSISITLPEFMSLGVPFTCKTLEDRDKQLIAGNIKESTFDLDFDARAYRFNSSAKFDLYHNGAYYAQYTPATIDTVPETLDAVNPTNDDSNVTYNIAATAARQIYKSDGTTIGGTGVNVSYTFGTNSRIGATGIKAIKDADSDDSGYNPNTSRVGGTTYSIGVTNLDGTSVIVDLSNEFSNTKSSQMNANFQGYARGEVYRFGIVFYSKTGQRSYVKWIGDIKMPDSSYYDTAKVSHAQDDLNCVLDHQSNTSTYTYNLFPIFTVDISSIQDQISGFEIVRVERTSSDMTRLGTGMLSGFVDYSTGDGTGSSVTAATNANTLLRNYCASAPAAFYVGATRTSSAFSNTSTAVDSCITVGTTDYGDSETATGGNPNSTLMLADFPGFPGRNDVLGSTDAATKRLCIFNSPIVDFRDYTGFDVNTTTDYIQDLGYYSTVPYVWQDSGAVSGSANFHSFDLGFLFRSQQFVSLATAGQTVKFYGIAKSKILDEGEVLLPSEDVLDSVLGSTIDGNNVEAVCNTTYTYYGKSTADDYTPFGIGTEKQMLHLSNTASGFKTAASSLNIYNPNTSGGSWYTMHSTPYTQYFKEVAYCRQVSNQYGGNTYEARSKNEYITTGAYQIVNEDSATSLTVSTFGGDVVVLHHDREYIRQYHSGFTPAAPLKTAISSRMSIGMIYGCETPVNTAFRTGKHWGGENDTFFRGSIVNDASRIANDLSGNEEFVFNLRHLQSNNLKTDYLAKDILAQDEEIFPNRIKVSKTKIDGELIDNWRSFPANQFDDVDGSLGEINKLIAYKDQLIYFQDRGIGILPINERAVIEDVTGAELILGDGQLIGKYKYLTETSGTKHQHSVVVTDKGVYYYDSLQQKIYMLQGESLTEALGLHGYFHGNIKEVLRDSDELYKSGAIGVHAVYDSKNERVLFTLLNGNKIITVANGYYDVDDIVVTAEGYLQCIKQGEYITSEVIDGNNFKLLSNYYPGITIGYRERLQAFESFYDYRPGKFLNIDDKLLSIDPSNRNRGHIHEEGNYGTFYDNAYTSDITLVVMPNPNIISIFDNLEYYSEVTINKQDVVDDTFDSILCWNEYQNTGSITLTVGTLAKRRMRTWRHQLKRDTLGTSLNTISKPRLRNYYIFLKLSFENGSNKRVVLSDVVISYTPTKM